MLGMTWIKFGIIWLDILQDYNDLVLKKNVEPMNFEWLQKISTS